AEVKRAASPHEVLLVADALTGQDAVNLARAFDERVGLTGIVLTRIDGDGRGGAALSMRAVTGKSIKLVGTGEQLDALEDFHPARIADRILGMGDIVSLVEKAAATIDAERAQRVAEKMRKGAFDLADLREQIVQMQKIGGMSSLLGMMPGIAKMKNQLAKLAEKMPGGLPGGLPGAPGLPNLPAKFPGGSLPGLGGKLPGLGGMPGLPPGFDKGFKKK